ncbi:MAG: hypothetical protein Q4E54_00790 [Lachnospiraceae bacterium]|nr:hypothetical protein [Lachnospiraceae bacterium]
MLFDINMNDVFWAKKKEKCGIYFWLPLKQHLTDTAGMALCLFNDYIGYGVRKEIEYA